ncbi:unnamed protein product [Diplocarpon coronariae]
MSVEIWNADRDHVGGDREQRGPVEVADADATTSLSREEFLHHASASSSIARTINTALEPSARCQPRPSEPPQLPVAFTQTPSELSDIAQAAIAASRDTLDALVTIPAAGATCATFVLPWIPDHNQRGGHLAQSKIAE